jgi:hypothetical protein
MTRPFQPIGRLADGTVLLFTAPAQLTASPTEEQFTDYIASLRQIRVPWIWVVDCRGMTADHFLNMSMGHRLQRILREEHSHLLKDTWMMFLHSWLRAALAIFQAPVTALSGDRLELLVHLQRAGVERTAQDWLLAQLATASTPHRSLRH